MANLLNAKLLENTIALLAVDIHYTHAVDNSLLGLLQGSAGPPAQGPQARLLNFLTGRLESSLSAECSQCYLPGHGYHGTEALSQ
jgi:hypothetical protein